MSLSKPESVIKQFGTLMRTKGMKRILLDMVVNNIRNKLEVTRNMLYLDRHFKRIDSSQLFEWDINTFIKRMDPNIKYIDILRLEHPHCLDLWKFLTDLNCIEDILREILDNRGSAKTMLKGCLRLLAIRHELSHEYAENSKIFGHLKLIHDRYEKTEHIEMQEKNDKVNETSDRCMDEEYVSDPILQRYIRNSQIIHFDNIEDKLLEKAGIVERRNLTYHNTITRNNYVFKKVMEHYELEIEELKSKIGYWSWKYENNYEKVDNDLTYNKLALRSMKKQWEDSIARMQFFREDLVRIAEKEKRDIEIEAEREAERLLHAANKKRKSKKRKGKAKY